MATPYALISLERTISTQDEAAARLDSDPVLVVTERQTGGRGRQGRLWESAPRSMAASIAMRPSRLVSDRSPSGWAVETWPRLALVAGLAARVALGHGLMLKWPNDLMAPRGKVGGILVEVTGEVAVVGLGVNTWWPTPPPGRAALLDDDPGPGFARALAEAWAEEFFRRVEHGPYAWGVDEYRAVCSTIGRLIRWKPAGAGRVLDITAEGALRVATDQGEQVISAGEVWEIRQLDGTDHAEH